MKTKVQEIKTLRWTKLAHENKCTTKLKGFKYLHQKVKRNINFKVRKEQKKTTKQRRILKIIKIGPQINKTENKKLEMINKTKAVSSQQKH